MESKAIGGEMARNFRIGLIVPSSNTTMETEIPELLRRRSELESETFTFHSSRARLKNVTKEELWQMVCDSDRCALELSDARVDAMAYACLVALMSQPAGFHREAEERLERVAAGNGAPAPVVSSAGALVEGVRALGVSRVAVVAPYVKPVAALVVDYLQQSGVEVVDYVALEVSDNFEVGQLDPTRLPEIAQSLDTSSAEAVVLSACVQMPSLAVIQEAEDALGLPVLSAATATAYGLLRALGLRPVVPGAGALLAGTRPVAGVAS
jgi:maleate isomerase